MFNSSSQIVTRRTKFGGARIVNLILLVLMLAGCGAPATTTPPTAAPAGSPTAEPKPTGPISFMITGSPEVKAAYEKVVAGFEATHPDIKVEVIYIPKGGDYDTRLGADMTAGTPADVIFLDYRHFGIFAAKNALDSLAPRLAQSTLVKEADFYPAPLDAFRWGGKIMCIPQNLSSLVVYYNKSLFDAAKVAYPKNDWTWDDFLAAAKALTLDTNGDGESDQFGLGTEPALIRAAPFVWQNGGELVDNQTNPTKLLLTENAQSRAGLQFFLDLQLVHHVVPNKEAEASEDSLSRFQNGSVAMYLDSRKVVPAFRGLTDLDWDVAPLPAGANRATILHTDAYCLPSASKHKEAAWAFIEYANTVTGQTILAETGRTVPSLKAVAESPAFLTPNTKPANAKAAYLDMAPYVRPVPNVAAWGEVEEISDAELQRAYYGDAPVDEVLETLIKLTAEKFAPATQ